LWAHGARREAYEQLVAWHATAGAQPDAAARAAYLRAVAWWSPIWTGEAAPPAAAELVGPERCRFGCRASEALGDDDAERALLGSPFGARVTDPADAAAWAAIALRGALRGDGSWSQQLASRVELAKLDLHALPRIVRPTFARLMGVVGKREPAPTQAELDAATADERFVAAAERVVAGNPPAAVRATLGTALDRADARALLAIVEPTMPVATADARARVVARYVAGRTGAAGADDEAAFVELARAFDRDPAIAERLGREYVARSVDAALAHAAVGAAFEALGDPRLARIEWQAAADGDPGFAAGLAEAIARAGDGDAALVAVAAGAAGSGDPAPVLVLVAHALLDAKRPIEAIAAARSAIDLAGPEALAPALDVAIAASHVAKRDAQADSLLARRATLAPPLSLAALPFDDPTDAASAYDALGHSPTAGAEAARAWVAAAWNPRAVPLRVALLGALPATDPRRPTIIAELVELAGAPDGDFEAALRAARAVRVQR
jgi:tetratricopeptide (TPR) repeat protein